MNNFILSVDYIQIIITIILNKISIVNKDCIDLRLMQNKLKLKLNFKWKLIKKFAFNSLMKS
jgi:hypothetical protein